MARFRLDRVFLLLTGASLAFSLLLGVLLGISSLLGILEFGVINEAVMSATYFLAMKGVRRFSFQNADEAELKAEDDILLQATAFSQAVLWIYLGLMPPDFYVSVMKWFIPLAAIIFYSSRAYAKLKNSNFWRYYSMYALCVVAAFSLSLVIRVSIESPFENILLIDGVKVGTWLIVTLLSQAAAVFVFSLKDRIRKRYGLP